jgi:23S rRNA (cytidine2498-2'-O)-methyltransferase
MEFLKAKAYLAARGFFHHLLSELGEPSRIDGELVTGSENDPPDKSDHVYWTRNVWEEPFILEFGSISEASKALRSIQRNWAAYPTNCQRRTALIAQALPPVPDKPKPFPLKLPEAPMGNFTLLDEHTLYGSAKCSNPFPNGEFSFVEDRLGPPSRAYRKLWEALIYAKDIPSPGQRCLDAGASPGGWTWALAGLGASVFAIDRAPLDESVRSMPGVEYLRHDAFTLKPEDIGAVDWLFSDVICYPQALYDWIMKWIDSGLASRCICTIKMQGSEWDSAITEKFAAIPGSRIIHLWHNRHELTWIRTGI